MSKHRIARPVVLIVDDNDDIRGVLQLMLEGMVADGMSADDILRAYPDLEREDIREALRYAAAALQERELPLLPSR